MRSDNDRFLEQLIGPQRRASRNTATLRAMASAWSNWSRDAPPATDWPIPQRKALTRTALAAAAPDSRWISKSPSDSAR